MQSESVVEVPPIAEVKKICSKCGLKKDTSQFYFRFAGEPERGVRSGCRRCDNEVRAQWEQKNRPFKKTTIRERMGDEKYDKMIAMYNEKVMIKDIAHSLEIPVSTVFKRLVSMGIHKTRKELKRDAEAKVKMP